MLNSRNRKTLEALFAEPVNGNIRRLDIEALLRAVGCRVVEGAGSSVMFEKSGAKAYFHRPHPAREALRYRVKDARAFLCRIGVTAE